MTAKAAIAAWDSCPCCENKGTKTCSECRDIAYCSAKCQKADWKYHKHLCKSVKSFQQPPAPNMRRCVYFAADGEKPVFKWMPMKGDIDWQYISTKTDADLRESYHPEHIFLKIRTNQLLAGNIVLQYDDEFDRKYARPNSAIIAATNGRAPFVWKGPIIASTGESVRERNGDLCRVHDFSMSQYSALISYLVFFDPYKNKTELTKLYHDLKTPVVQAIRMLPARNGASDTMTPVNISTSHPVFYANMIKANPIMAGYLKSKGVPGEISDISVVCSYPLLLYHSNTLTDGDGQLIDMPMIAWKYPTPPGWQQTVGYTSMAYMFCSMDKDAGKFGLLLLRWTHYNSDVLLVREDEQPLDQDTAAAFLAFCQYHVGPFVDWALEAGKAGRVDQSPRIKTALAEVTPAKWASYKIQYNKMLIGSADVTAEKVGDETRMGLAKADVGKVVTRFLGDQVLDLAGLSFD